MSYVGCTKHKSSQRWSGHKEESKAGSTQLLHKAIRSFGSDNFILADLETQISSDMKDERERYWISECNTQRPNGYNLQSGGKSGYRLDPISQHENNLLQRINNTKPERKEAIRLKGLRHSEYYKTPEGLEAIKSQSRKISGSLNVNFYKGVSVQMLSSDLIHVIQVFESINGAARWIISNTVTADTFRSISNRIRYKSLESTVNNLAYGFRWRYKHEAD